MLTHLRLHGLCGEWKALPRALCRGCAWNGVGVGVGIGPRDKPRRGGEIVVLLQWVSRESLSRNLPVYQKVIYYGN